MFKPIIDKSANQNNVPIDMYRYNIHLEPECMPHCVYMTEECAEQLQQYIDKVHPPEKSDLTGAGDEGDHWV